MKLKFNQDLFVPKGTYVIGVSGGVDSMVLLSSMVSIQDRLNLKLVLVHMNYHQRPTSDQDEALVLSYAKEHHIEAHSFDFVSSPFGNFQQEARNQRYHRFYELAKDKNADAICLAHHADDQMETILMRINRGTSFVGYAGMKEVSLYKDMPLLRPLIKSSKQELIDYAKENNVPYLQDESNMENHYTRNRYRHEVTPFLKSENPKSLEKWNEFSDDILEAYHLISKHSTAFIEKNITLHNNVYSFEINLFQKEEKIVQKDILKRLTNLASSNQTELTTEHIDSMNKIMNSKNPNLKKRFDAHLFVYKSYQKMSFTEKEIEVSPFEIIINDFSEIKLPNNDLIIISQNKRNNDGKTIELWYNNLDSLFPLTLRSRKEKDLLHFSYGTKKLKDHLMDKKIPLSERNELPILVDSTGEIRYIPSIYTFIPDKKENKIYITYLKG